VEFPLYATLSVSVPALRLPAGTVKENVPVLESAVAGEVYVPAVSVTVPVGVAPVPVTVPVTLRL
jgi:hypothetical protein